MKRTRWPVVLLVLGAVAALVAWFPGREDVVRSDVPRSPVAAAVGDEGGSWYCAAVGIGVEGASVTVIVTSVGDRDAAVRLDGFGAEGAAGTLEVALAAGTTQVVDVAASLGAEARSVMVESDAPVVVEHRTSSDAGADQAPCSTFSSDSWYFPAVVTSRDATASLALFNPFPGDASVDVEVALDTGVRKPAALSGLVVPAGTTSFVDLGESVQRRDQFSVTVRTRSGGIVAELAQVFDGSGDLPVKGVRLVPGTRTPQASWSLAGGFADAAARERLVVLNPAEEPVTVLVQVVPFGATEALPEPFELTVPGLRYQTLDLDQESRVTQVGFHSVEVESVDGSPVVAARSVDITDSADGGEANPLRASITAGTTAAPGGAVAAQRWVSTGVGADDQQAGLLFVHNPADEPTVARLVAVAPDGTAGEPVEYEVPAGDSVAVALSELSTVAGSFTAEVEADSPVTVERLLVLTEAADISLQPSVPVLGDLGGLEVLGG